MDKKDKITRTQTIEEAVTEAVGARNGDWFWTVAAALSRIAELEAELEGVRERGPSRVVVSELQVEIAELRSESEHATRRANEMEAKLGDAAIDIAELGMHIEQHHRQEQGWKHSVWVDPIRHDELVSELKRVRAERDALAAWKELACKVHGSQSGEDLDAIVSRRL